MCKDVLPYVTFLLYYAFSHDLKLCYIIVYYLIYY